MAENSAISWTDHTHSHWLGCMRVSNGPKGACAGCYAAVVVEDRFHRAVFGGPGKGVGTRALTSAANRRKPLGWQKKAAAKRAAGGGPTFVFCSSLADVFDNAVPVEWRRELFDLIRATPDLTWLLLTKRPQNIVDLFERAMETDGVPCIAERDWPRNAAIGCTAVTQEEVDRDVPVLLAAKAMLRPAFAFLSMEPLMEAVDLHRANRGADALTGVRPANGPMETGLQATEPVIDWVIVGGESDQSGHVARPCDPEWVRPIRDHCAVAGTAFHFKQWGSWHSDALRYTDTQNRCPPPNMRIGVKKAGRLLDGRTHDARPCVGLAG